MIPFYVIFIHAAANSQSYTQESVIPNNTPKDMPLLFGVIVVITFGSCVF